MKTHELLDRLEMLYPENKHLGDLRRAFIDDDRNSLQRVIANINPTELTDAIRVLESNDNFVYDSLSQGQIKSKLWLINELKKLNLDLGTLFLCAGWYAILATLIFESSLKVDKIRSFDIDESCIKIAETFNKKWYQNNWQFKSITQDIMEIDYIEHTWQFWSNKNNRMSYPISDVPNTIINTSCEHIKDFNSWYSKIPAGRLLILQTNNYFDNEQHSNCVAGVDEALEKYPMGEVFYSGEIETHLYNRYMIIGRK